jgi:hypothetical protein
LEDFLPSATVSYFQGFGEAAAGGHENVQTAVTQIAEPHTGKQKTNFDKNLIFMSQQNC